MNHRESRTIDDMAVITRALFQDGAERVTVTRTNTHTGWRTQATLVRASPLRPLPLSPPDVVRNELGIEGEHVGIV